MATVFKDSYSLTKPNPSNKIFKSWDIFDFYEGGSIAEGKKSIAFRLTFQSDERTLTDKEVNKIHDKLLASLRDQLGAELR